MIAPFVRSVPVSPSVSYIRSSGTAIKLHHHRIFLLRVEILRKRHKSIQVKPVVLYAHHLRRRTSFSQGDILILKPFLRILVHSSFYFTPWPARRGKRCRETAPVFRKFQTGKIKLRIRQSRNASLAVQPVQSEVESGVPFGRKPHVSFLLIHLQKGYVPVLTGSEPFQSPVISKEINLLPSGLEIPGHIQTFLRKYHPLYPFHPCGVLLMIHGTTASITGADGIQVQDILSARLPADIQFLRVRTPERCTEILVVFLRKIRPHYFHILRATHIRHTYAHGRIGLTGLRISGLPQFSILPERGINRKHRHGRIVKPVKSYLPGIRTPPESPVIGSAPEYLLIIHP